MKYLEFYFEPHAFAKERMKSCILNHPLLLKPCSTEKVLIPSNLFHMTDLNTPYRNLSLKNTINSINSTFHYFFIAPSFSWHFILCSALSLVYIFIQLKNIKRYVAIENNAVANHKQNN